MIFEPILFGLTGTQFKLSELDPQIVSIAAIIVIGGVVVSWQVVERIQVLIQYLYL